jgi:hypothetical protein
MTQVNLCRSEVCDLRHSYYLNRIVAGESVDWEKKFGWMVARGGAARVKHPRVKVNSLAALQGLAPCRVPWVGSAPWSVRLHPSHLSGTPLTGLNLGASRMYARRRAASVAHPWLACPCRSLYG